MDLDSNQPLADTDNDKLSRKISKDFHSPFSSRKIPSPSPFICTKKPINSVSVKGQGVDVKSVKSVLVGDAHIGKTSLVHSFLFNEFNKDYNPTCRDDYTFCTTVGVEGQVSGQRVKVDVDLDICDTGGQTYLDRLRPLCYGNGVTTTTDVTIICFSVVVPSSFMNVTRRWIPELKRHCLNLNKGMKTILVGTQSDLRSNVNILLQLMDDGLTPISETQAIRLAKKVGALTYLECSAINNYNIKKIFDTAMTSCVTAPTPTLPSPQSNFLLNFNFNFIPQSPQGQGDKSQKGSLPVAPKVGTVGAKNTNVGDRKLFWKRWRLRQKSNKIKGLMLSCLH